ncbi:TerC family protein [Paenibacillus tyrfis]|uniref:TerC family protein n=1 Tax=Paenibacillus tyrfis TaxID=1501230 RepID=UPI00209EB5C1|nr:TerC family protein [Paenibacillus tyrfis]MCP1312172.1 TerC family protein [Paenibacillus tyrfis]
MEGDLLVGLLKLILINIVLSGDNAVVIALACRNLPAEQQKKAIFWGSFGAILLRIVLTFVAVWLLKVPFVQVAGALLLLYIAVKLLKGEDNAETLKSSSKIGEAIQTIIVADLVMSLDNVLAVAGAAGGNLLLIVVGLAISIPLIVWGSQLLMRLMNRFPVIVLLGAALLGYTAGEMTLSDKAVGHWIETTFPAGHYVLPIGLAVLVVVVGKLASRRQEREHAKKEAEKHAVS